jgi:predicted Zn-dependent protease
MGAALIDSRFSREAEREADRFAADVALRLSFQPAALAKLLERVAGDDAFTAALALLSTHPLTSERRAYLESLGINEADLRPAFTDEEWRAIKSMCGTAAPSSPPAGGPLRPEKSGGKGG